jgi:hypothetical protein
MRRSYRSLLALLVAPFAYGCVTDDGPVSIPSEPPLPPIVTEAPGTLEIDTTVVDFGYVDCGSAPVSKSIHVKNSGGKALAYSLRLEGSGFSIDGAPSGSLEPAAEAVVTVTASVDSSATPRVPREGAIVIESPDSALPQVRVPLKVIPDGAVLSVLPASAAFGQVNVGEFAVPVQVTLKNTGYAPVKLGFAVPKDDEFGLAWTNVPDPIALGPTESKTVSATFAPKSAGKKSFTSALTIDGPVCGDVPKTFELAGEGVLLPVTVTPSPLDFGSVDCGTTAAAKTVSIENENAFPVVFSAVLAGAPSPFTISPASGTVAPKSTAAITVSPKGMVAPRSVAPNAYGDQLTITTNAPADLPHVVTIMQSARGAILSASLPNAAFGAQTVGATVNRTLTVQNSGNQSATVKLTTALPFAVSPASPAAVTIAGGASGTATVSFTPTSSTPASANVSLAITGPQCGPPPAAIPVSGSGAFPVFSITGRFSGFNVTCGAAVTGQSIVLANDASAAGKLLITNVQVTGPFTVSPASLAAIDPGKSATLTVTPKAPVIGTDSATQVDAGQLSFKTNEAGGPTRTLGFSRTVHGANLAYALFDGNAFVPTSHVDFDGCPAQTPVPSTFFLRNTGDQDAAAVTLATFPEWAFADPKRQTTFGILAGGAVQIDGTYSGAINASRPPVVLSPASSSSSNVCIRPPALEVQYNLLSSQDRRCVIIL